MLVSLLNADLIKDYQQMMEDIEYSHFCQQHPYLSRLPEWYRRWRYKTRMWINRQILCPILGHEQVSTTIFTSDQGIERWWCNRCDAHGINALY